jgi:hypothetical protein
VAELNRCLYYLCCGLLVEWCLTCTSFSMLFCVSSLAHTHTRQNMHSPDVLYLYFRKRTAIYTTSLELSQIMQDCIGMNYKDTQDMNFLMTNICGWWWDTWHFLLFFAFDSFVIVFSLLLGICCGWFYFKRKYICSEEHTIIYTNTNCCFDFSSILFTDRVQEALTIKDVCQNIAERNSYVKACLTSNFLSVQI